MNVEGIILAAGFSSRAGAFKMGLTIAGKPLIHHTIDNMSDFCSRIIVVGGHKIEKLIELIQNYANIQVILNEKYRSGMFSSVKEGVKNLKGDKFFLIPGDCPLVKKEVYRELLQTRGDIVIPSFQGRKGHPVLIRSSLTAEILREPENSNLRDFIRRKGYETIAVEDSGILLDIDTQEDYKIAKKRS
jgi:molybdenum cofactor cytidylyltransferase